MQLFKCQMRGKAVTPEGCVAIWRNHDRLVKWAAKSSMKFSKGNCEGLHLGKNQPRYPNVLWATQQEGSLAENDLVLTPHGMWASHPSPLHSAVRPSQKYCHQRSLPASSILLSWFCDRHSLCLAFSPCSNSCRSANMHLKYSGEKKKIQVGNVDRYLLNTQPESPASFNCFTSGEQK